MALTARQKKIIKLLSVEGGWIKANKLAGLLNVTSRTIRNDIRNMDDSDIILSSKDGYKLNDKYRLPGCADTASVPSSPNERVYYILNKLLTSSGYTDIYDMADEMFVSSSTLENDLKKVVDIIKDFNLELKKASGKISIDGKERNKRKLINKIISDETDNSFIDLGNFDNFFKDYDLYYIKDIISGILKSYNLYINEYSITSLVLHIAITLSRVSKRCILPIGEYTGTGIENCKEYGISKKIVKALTEKYNIEFPIQEVYYLTFLIMSRITINYSTININNIGNYIEEYYIDLVNQLLSKVNRYYYLDLNDEEFLIKFILHIKSMLFRVKNSTYCRNPLNKSIKSTYPFIYEIAVFISNEIYVKTGLKINDDEIGYLALHIGGALEKEKILSKKIRTAIVCPEYHNIHLKIIEKLLNRYDDSIEITNIVTTFGPFVNKLSADLIITTMPLDNIVEIPCVTINPFLIEEDYIKIDCEIQKIKCQRNKFIIGRLVKDCFDRNLFEKNIYFNDKFEAIKYLGKKLFLMGIVEDDFIDSVIKREELSSTSFGYNFAIPHAIEMNSKKTVISVLITDKPIKWDDSHVQLVLLIAINKHDRKAFMKLYESLVSVLSRSENIEMLAKSNNYDDFISHITRLSQGDTIIG